MIQRFLTWARTVLQRLFGRTTGPHMNIRMDSDMLAALENGRICTATSLRG